MQRYIFKKSEFDFVERSNLISHLKVTESAVLIRKTDV